MQLTRWVVAAALLWPAVARADGAVTVRGAYYKERATRVAQPMLDARFDVGEDGELTAHTLVDSISSASVAAGSAGEPFDELRYEAGAGYMHRVLDVLRLGGAVRGSTEPDYKSLFATARAAAELNERNTTIELTVSGGRDRLDNAGAQTMIVEPITGVLYTWLASTSVSQVLSPVLVGQLTYDIAYLDGFQENPYRTVSAGGGLEMERVPDTRLRHAVFGAVRGFVPATRTTLTGGYRVYHDDWGVWGHTPEARVVQAMGDVDLHLRYRLHHQSRADFYRPSYPTADPAREPYLTDDVKLSKLTTQTIGLKADLPLSLLGARGELEGARLETLFEYIFQSTYYGNAVVAQVAVTVPFEY